MSRQRVRQLVGATLTVVVAAVAPGAVAHATDKRARITGPEHVRPGKVVTFRARGFAPGKPIFLGLQPTTNRGGNGFGIAVRKRFVANANGSAQLRFRWPRHYFGCAGANDCRKHPWKRGSRVDVNAGAIRAVTRIARRKARKRGGKAKLRRCGTVIFTPNSGDGLFKIRARGIGCRKARKKLRSWARTGTRGYDCRTVRRYRFGNERMSCRRRGHRLPVIAFDTGL